MSLKECSVAQDVVNEFQEDERIGESLLGSNEIGKLDEEIGQVFTAEQETERTSVNMILSQLEVIEKAFSDDVNDLIAKHPKLEAAAKILSEKFNNVKELVGEVSERFICAFIDLDMALEVRAGHIVRLELNGADDQFVAIEEGVEKQKEILKEVLLELLGCAQDRLQEVHAELIELIQDKALGIEESEFASFVGRMCFRIRCCEREAKSVVSQMSVLTSKFQHALQTEIDTFSQLKKVSRSQANI